MQWNVKTTKWKSNQTPIISNVNNAKYEITLNHLRSHFRQCSTTINAQCACSIGFHCSHRFFPCIKMQRRDRAFEAFQIFIDRLTCEFVYLFIVDNNRQYIVRVWVTVYANRISSKTEISYKPHTMECNAYNGHWATIQYTGIILAKVYQKCLYICIRFFSGFR